MKRKQEAHENSPTPDDFVRAEAWELLRSDYAVVVAERSALRQRLERRLERAKLYPARTPAEHAVAVEAMCRLLDDQNYLDKELLVYRHNVLALDRLLADAPVAPFAPR